MKIPAEITQMNRGQMLVVVISIAAIGYIIANRFIIPNDCMNRMCPVNDTSWIWQTGVIAAAGAVAYWLLKDGSNNS